MTEKLRIKSDGTPFGTSVFLGEKDITKMVAIDKIQINIESGGRATATLTIHNIDLEMELPADKVSYKIDNVLEGLKKEE